MNNYTLSLQEAAIRCLNKEGYIRGEHFSEGFYIKPLFGRLVLKEKGKDTYKNVLLEDVMVNQNYKLFTNLTDEELQEVEE